MLLLQKALSHLNHAHAALFSIRILLFGFILNFLTFKITVLIMIASYLGYVWAAIAMAVALILIDVIFLVWLSWAPVRLYNLGIEQGQNISGDLINGEYTEDKN